MRSFNRWLPRMLRTQWSSSACAPVNGMIEVGGPEKFHLDDWAAVDAVLKKGRAA